MKSKVLVFAGTTEGGNITDFLARSGVEVHACVATEYGRTSVGENPNVEVSSHPLAPGEMRSLMKEFPIVVDATHPYAVRITGHIKEACEDIGAEYIRLRRPSTFSGGDDVVTVDSVDEAVEYLKGRKGKVLVTTGSKELEKYTRIPDYKERVFARALSLAKVAQSCAEIGFEGKNIFLMQGPFSEELDYAMLRQVGAKYLVTKDSGTAGGFDEKVAAARRAGATVILIGRPSDDPGRSYGETVGYLSEKLGLDPPPAVRRLSIVGTGVGPGTGLTSAAAEAVRDADLLVGAERMLRIPEADGKAKLREYVPGKIFSYLGEHPEFSGIAVLVSGDVGFYSAAKSILAREEASAYDVRLHCGISSVQYLCARAGVPWQDAKLVSAHGRMANIVGEVRRSPLVFALLNGKEGVNEMCSQLSDFNMGRVKVAVGCDLGYPEERYFHGTPEEVAAADLGHLCAALIFNPSPDGASPICMTDSEFIRGDAPMTKCEVRALSVAKLKLCDDSVVYDVGAGTGSVSIEMARVAVDGTVYAIEKEDAAAGLIDQNRRKFGCPNVIVVKGLAPEAMKGLPAPTHVFVGGSSGNLKDIVGCALEKNPGARVVVNSVTLETISEVLELVKTCPVEQEDIVCINAASSRKLGGYNLMTSQNPVYIATFRGKGE